jgi:hypothetical protein
MANSLAWISATGQIPVTIDTSNGNLATGAVSTVSVTLSVANNSNRVLVALIGNDNTLTVSGVAFTSGSASGTWTKLTGSMSNPPREEEIWYVTGPSTGSVTVQATFSGNIVSDGVIVLYSLYNVNQSTPVDTYTSTVATTESLSVSTSASNLVLVMLAAAAAQGAITSGVQDYTNSNNSIWAAGHNTDPSSATVSWANSANGRGMDGCNVNHI